MPQYLQPIQEPPFQIYELETTTQGPLQVQAVDFTGATLVPLDGGLFVDPDTAVPTPQQNGSIGQPFATVQQAVDTLSGRGNGTILLSPGIYPAEAVTASFISLTLFGLGSTNGAQADLGSVSITTDFPLAVLNLGNLGAITSTSSVLFRDTFSNNAVQADTFVMYDSSCGTITITGTADAFNSTFIDGGSAARITARGSALLTAGTSYFFTSGGGEMWDCDVFADLLATSPTFRECNLSGAFTGSTFTAYTSRLQGGSVNVTDQIALDQSTYQSALPASWVATNSINIVDAPWSPEGFQIGWNAAVVSSAFDVQIAGQHPPGLYLVYAPLVVRTVAAAGTATRTITWNAPTIGAQSHVTAGFLLTTLGTKAQDVVAVASDGSAGIRVQYTPVGLAGGPPVIDVYAASLQGGKRS